MDKAALIQQVDVFASLDEASSERLLRDATLVEFERDAHIIKKGDRLVVRGDGRSRQETKSGDDDECERANRRTPVHRLGNFYV